jgi:phage shock protein C
MQRVKKLYLDKQNAVLAGVCAGIADYIGWKPRTVRILWVIATICWTPVMIAAYVLAAWLLDARQGSGYDFAAAAAPLPKDPMAPRRRFVDVKARFDLLEARLRTLETVVTSKEFQIDRELGRAG